MELAEISTSSIRNIEIIGITTVNGKMSATLSFQNTEVSDLNNGYSLINVPVNIRPLQYSAYGNVLVDQSVKQESFPAVNINQ